jgi:metal-responsive CopG/Arc/MetJ family transcriptional regulator
MVSKPERIERLQVVIPLEELQAIDDFRFQHRRPSRTAAVRELLRRGLAASEKPTQ